ncbi:hypothetical protein [Tianweitania aestuarii]|nr:hypothetical protein [Tianweitania aestuarii]
MPSRVLSSGCAGDQEWDMDFVMIGLAVAFFAASFAYIQTCSKL